MRGNTKLSKKERQELMLNLCQAPCALKNPEEVAEVLTDLLYPAEIGSIAIRLKIAELLVRGENYRTIRDVLKVGYSTIARVNTWLNLSGQGYKILLSRKRESLKEAPDEEKYDPLSWYNLKRRRSIYFWPQLLLEELIRNSDRKEKEKIARILEKIKIKSSTFTSQTNKQLYELFSSKFSKVQRPQVK